MVEVSLAYPQLPLLAIASSKIIGFSMRSGTITIGAITPTFSTVVGAEYTAKTRPLF
jgi:hypothetical protein